jgi:mRNA interferase RelE/StbE
LKVKFAIEFTDLALRQLRDLARSERLLVLEAVERFLSHEPEKVSKSRIKRLRGFAVPAYRLRLGELRIYYSVTNQTVTIHGTAPKDDQDDWLQRFGQL